MQLELFEIDEMVLLRKELSRVKESNEKVRRSLFAKQGELSRNYIELQDRLETIERKLCTK